MVTSLRSNSTTSRFLSRLKTLLNSQRFNHVLAEREMGSDSVPHQGRTDMSKWKKVDARMFGITQSMIPPPLWIVLKVLRGEGFDAYLVGGCVRDLILNKIPKDFDVITTAKLKQIQNTFHNSKIVGQRFPICMVHVKRSVIEVSSFETVAQHAKGNGKTIFSGMPSGCDEKDLLRWRNSIQRDFTVNSLFLDPYVNKIYDYTNGMADLKSLKLRTLIPAQLSFKEDCARILRGLRIGARLGLSFSKDTETAIRNLSSSIKSLAKSRIMMELNYMLSYGAAESSLCLLRRFNLLEVLLPFQAAYLDQQASKKSAQHSMMLMKLFFNLDKLLACDRPSNCCLWVGLLAFHLALINNPQDALIVWAFASVLYHGKWKEGVKFAREQAQVHVNFSPEVSGSSDVKSDEELAKEVTQLASLVQDSIPALIEADSLSESMSRYQVSPCSGLVFIPQKTGNYVAQIFEVLVNDIESYENGRDGFWIDYRLLGKGDLCETRFVLGKVILETMRGGIIRGGTEVVEDEKNHLLRRENEQKPEVIDKDCDAKLSHLIKTAVVKKDKRHGLLPSNHEVQQGKVKKQKLVEKAYSLSKQEAVQKKHEIDEVNTSQEVVEKLLNVGKEEHHISQDEVTRKKLKAAKKCNITSEERTKHEEVLEKKRRQILPQEVAREKIEKHNQHPVKKQGSWPLLSSLFK